MHTCKSSVLRAATFGLLACAPLLANAPLASQANAALGLTDSLVGVVDVFGDPASGLLVSVDVGQTPMVFELEPHALRAPGFQLLEQGADGTLTPVEPAAPSTYRGVIAGAEGSSVAASVHDEGVFARLILPGQDEAFWLQPVGSFLPGASPSDHVLFSDSAVIEGGYCGTQVLPQPRELQFSAQPKPQPAPGTPPLAATGLHVTELACDADYEYFLDYGTSAATQNRIEAVINAINQQYESEVDITHTITTIIVRTTSNDPYSSTDAVTLLNQFRNHWNANQGSVPRDVAQLFTGKEIQGGTIGIAWLNAVCSSYGYGVVQSDFNGNFGCATDLSAHELGHNWGADHCNCTSYTMNPYITCANTFSPNATIPDITSFRDSINCLDHDDGGGPGGGDPTSLSVASVTPLTVSAGKGKKYARAQVLVQDDQGNPVAGASVTVSFTGGINETVSGSAGGNGVATLTTSGSKKGKLKFTACVTSVSGSLPYDAGGNAETCDSN